MRTSDLVALAGSGSLCTARPRPTRQQHTACTAGLKPTRQQPRSRNAHPQPSSSRPRSCHVGSMPAACQRERQVALRATRRCSVDLCKPAAHVARVQLGPERRESRCALRGCARTPCRAKYSACRHPTRARAASRTSWCHRHASCAPRGRTPLHSLGCDQL